MTKTSLSANFCFKYSLLPSTSAVNSIGCSLLISPEFAPYSLALHKQLVSNVIKRLSTLPSLVLSTWALMFEVESMLGICEDIQSGFYQVPSCVLRIASLVLVSFFWELSTRIMFNRTLTDIWKTSQTTIPLKYGWLLDVANYHRIHLLCKLSLIFERKGANFV